MKHRRIDFRIRSEILIKIIPKVVSPYFLQQIKPIRIIVATSVPNKRMRERIKYESCSLLTCQCTESVERMQYMPHLRPSNAHADLILLYL